MGTSFDNSLSLVLLNNSQAEERSMVTAAISGFDSVFESQSKLPSEFDCTMPWKETSEPTYCSKADSTDTKAALNKHFSKAIKSEVASLSPIVKRISEQVGRQFEERVSRIEEQVHRFLNSGLEMTSIKEKILEEVIGDVKKMNGAGGKLFNEATASSLDIKSKEDKENMINEAFSSQTSLESKDMEIEQWMTETTFPRICKESRL